MTIGWQPDSNDLGNLTFYDAAGHQITSGSTTASPMAAFYVSSAPGSATSGGVQFTTPVNGTNSGAWAGTQDVGAPNAFPVGSLPGDLAGFTGAVVKGAGTDGSFNDVQISAFPNCYGQPDSGVCTGSSHDKTDTPGYDNLYEVRMVVNGVTNKWYAADIHISGTTWTQVFPNQMTPTVTVSSTESSPQPSSTTVHLTATLSSALPGKVQFLDGSTKLGSPVVVSGSTATTTDVPALGSHSYTADFVPTPGSTGLAANSGSYSFTISDPTAPSTPTGLAAMASSQTLALSWTAPSNGGSAITGYTVTYTPAGGAPASVPTGSTATTYSLGGLSNGTSYTITVSATNAIGTSAASASIQATPNPLAPGAPTAVGALANNGSATVWFGAPGDSGGAPITGYTVTASTGQVATGVGSPIVVGGLGNGINRTFTVTATNSAGTGAASGPSNAVVYYSSGISIHPTVGVTVAGSYLRIYGSLASGPASSKYITLCTFPAGHPTTAVHAWTSATGAYSFTVRGIYTTSYKVVYAGDAIHAAVTSAIVKVTVRTKVVITSPKSGTRTTTRTLRVNGYTSPNKYNSLIYLYEIRSTGLVRLAVVRVNRYGVFSFLHTFARGTHVLQVRIGATTTNAAGSSARTYLYEV